MERRIMGEFLGSHPAAPAGRTQLLATSCKTFDMDWGSAAVATAPVIGVFLRLDIWPPCRHLSDALRAVGLSNHYSGGTLPAVVSARVEILLFALSVSVCGLTNALRRRARLITDPHFFFFLLLLPQLWKGRNETFPFIVRGVLAPAKTFVLFHHIGYQRVF